MQEWSCLSYPHLIHLEKVEKSDGFWKITVCFHKRNSVVTLMITHLVPDVVSFCKCCIFMQHGLWPWCAAINPANAFSSYQSAGHQKQFAFAQQGQQDPALSGLSTVSVLLSPYVTPGRSWSPWCSMKTSYQSTPLTLCVFGSLVRR